MYQVQMVKVSISREEIAKTSTDYLAKNNFILKSRTQNQLVFTGGRDINLVLLVLSFLFLLIGGVLYYLLSKTHTITVSLVETVNGLNVSVNGTTAFSRSIAKNYQDMLVTFDTGSSMGFRIQEIKCPKCGSPLDYTGNSKFVKCTFCGSSLSISELRK